MKRDRKVAPVWRLKKDEIIKIGRWRCEHFHSGLEHYSCFLKAHPETERVGLIDIEASNLKADFGIVICYSIMDLHSNEQMCRILTKEELFDYSHDPDYHLMEDCVRDMQSWDRLIGFYSGDYKFDIPFLRTRAVSQGIDFPGVNSIYFEDVYSTIKAKFCMSSNRLATAVRTLTGDTQKTNWYGKYWVRAIQGDPKALAYIKDHCLTPNHKVFMSDLTWKCLGDMKIGDEIISFDETNGWSTSGRHYRKAVITSKDFARAPVFAVELSNGEVFRVTEYHGWLVTNGFATGEAAYRWLPTNSLRIGKKYSTKLTKLFYQISQEHSYPSGYLAAMIDGEGWVDARGQIGISQRPGPVLNKIKDFLHTESFGLRLTDKLATRGLGKGDCQTLSLRGGLLHRINFLQKIRPQKIINLDISQWGRLERRPDAEVNAVVKIVPDGIQEIVRIGTSTGTLIVDGYPMHNCEKDVQDLKKLYLKVYPFTKHTNRSL